MKVNLLSSLIFAALACSPVLVSGAPTAVVARDYAVGRRDFHFFEKRVSSKVAAEIAAIKAKALGGVVPPSSGSGDATSGSSGNVDGGSIENIAEGEGAITNGAGSTSECPSHILKLNTELTGDFDRCCWRRRRVYVR